MQTRNAVVKAFWILVLAPLCMCCGRCSNAKGAEGTERKRPPRGSLFGVAFEPRRIEVEGKDRLDPKRGPWALAHLIIKSDGAKKPPRRRPSK